MTNTLNNEATESQATSSTDTNEGHSISATTLDDSSSVSNDKRSSILDRCKPSNVLKPIDDPDKLALIPTPKNEVFATFPVVIDLVVIVIPINENGFKTDEFYLVIDDLHDALADEKSLQSISIYMIQMLTGEISFTFCKNGPLTGIPCSWFVSKKVCIEESVDQWLSVSTNKDKKIYEVSISGDQPDLPSEGPDFDETLELVFEERIIDSLDHPILVANNIGQPKRTTKKAPSRRIRQSQTQNS